MSINNINIIATSQHKLNQYRFYAQRLYRRLGLEVPQGFECDTCGVNTTCRFAYAPINIKGTCAACVVRGAKDDGLGAQNVPKKAENQETAMKYAEIEFLTRPVAF